MTMVTKSWRRHNSGTLAQGGAGAPHLHVHGTGNIEFATDLGAVESPDDRARNDEASFGRFHLVEQTPDAADGAVGDRDRVGTRRCGDVDANRIHDGVAR